MEFLKYKLFIVFILLLESCISQHNQLRTENISNCNLRLSGYYYLHDDEGIESFFLYKNGIYLYNGSSGIGCESLTCHEFMISRKVNENNDTNYYEYQGNWGVFSIDIDKITIKRYWGIGFGSYGIQSMKGNILDSETIEITKFNGKDLKETWIYHFHPYSPKPDSTNNFIR
jgi:hypothetical protein